MDFFIGAIDILDEKVLSIKGGVNPELSAGTTILTVALRGGELNWLSVGDSRLYIIRGGNIARATRDHNYFLSLNEIMKAGAKNKEWFDKEAKRGEQLISYIGVGGVRIFDVNDAPFRTVSGDTVLLCTDGLYRALSDAEILRRSDGRDPGAAIELLFDESKRRFDDNTTCIIINCE